MFELKISQPELRWLFCKAVDERAEAGWVECFVERDGGLGGLAVDAVCQALALADDPIPDTAAMALGFPAGASYASAAAFITRRIQ